jgi:endonuclease YncB( thermonuclease family)
MSRLYALIAVLLFVASSANAAEWTRYRAVAPGAVRVIDGDTLAIRGKSSRVVGLQAPEIGKARCAAEKEQGLAAREYGRGLVDQSQNIQVSHALVRSRTTGNLKWARDKYGRYLVSVKIDGRDWTELVISSNHGVTWDGKGPSPGFC